MTYVLGVDLGTTFTAAAICKDGRVSIASLGNQAAAIPSVLLLKDDATILTGDAANRRGMTEPERVARDFKRRVGDTTPIFLGGAPQSAEALMARLLRWVADEVTAREGRPPEHLAVCHPANWGEYKQDLLAQAVRMADLGVATFVTEPEAAAVFYASEQDVAPGQVVAVYDLGGGTFDAAILRKTADSFEILGRPEGIERLGGIDFDAAVFAHVARSLEGRLAELDEDDPVAMSAVARLRQECVSAKEALSTDSDVSISVLLPNVQTEIRLTRSEFEAMIRPSLADTIGAMRRAFASAELTADDISAVLLVGGSSRIPLVSQLVGAELGRPVAVDTHPKYAVALGAAYAAAAAVGGSARRVTAAPAVTVSAAEPAAEGPAAEEPGLEEPVVEGATAEEVVAPAAALPDEAATAEAPPREVPPVEPPSEPPPGLPATAAPSGDESGSSRRPGTLVLALVAVMIVALIGGAGFALTRGSDESVVPSESTPPQVPSTGSTREAAVAPDRAELTTAVAGSYDPVLSTITVDAEGDEVTLAGHAYDSATKAGVLEAARQVAGVGVVNDEMVLLGHGQTCTEVMRSKTTWACFREVTWDGKTVRAEMTSSASQGGAPLDLEGFHLHVFGSNVPPAKAGAPGEYSLGGGTWRVWDDPTSFEGTLNDIGSPDGMPAELCVRVANAGHQLEQRESGNCWPITDFS